MNHLWQKNDCHAWDPLDNSPELAGPDGVLGSEPVASCNTVPEVTR